LSWAITLSGKLEGVASSAVGEAPEPEDASNSPSATFSVVPPRESASGRSSAVSSASCNGRASAISAVLPKLPTHPKFLLDLNRSIAVAARQRHRHRHRHRQLGPATSFRTKAANLAMPGGVLNGT
jgi:hypothetical protein